LRIIRMAGTGVSTDVTFGQYPAPIMKLLTENENNPSPQPIPVSRFRSGLWPNAYTVGDKEAWRVYQQWLNCITALSTDHIWCKKVRWYVEHSSQNKENVLKFDENYKKGLYEPSILGRVTESGSEPVGTASLFSETPDLHKNLLIFRHLWKKARANEEALLPGWFDQKKANSKAIVETPEFETQYQKIAEALHKSPEKFSDEERRRWEFGQAHTPLFDDMIALERERADKLTGKVMLYPPRNWPFEPINYESPEAFELWTDFGRQM